MDRPIGPEARVSYTTENVHSEAAQPRSNSWSQQPWADRFGDNIDDFQAIPWWLFLVTGALWMAFAFVVLSFDFRTVWAVAWFAGAAFIVAGLNEFMNASVVPNRKWLHIGLGVLFVGAGIFAVAWPTITFVALAAIIGWFLLFAGAFDIIGALIDRHELWWLRLIAGVIEIALGVWAIGYPSRSFALLAVWVAAAAVTRGVAQILLGIALRDAGMEPSLSGVSTQGSARDMANGPSPAPGRGGGRSNGERANGDGRHVDVQANSDDQRIIDDFRASAGHPGGDLEGEQVLLVHSTDANGRDRVNPVCYQVDGDRIIIYPTGIDGSETPEWYANLLSDSHGRVETGQENFDVEAHVPDAEEARQVRTRGQGAGTNGAATSSVEDRMVRPVLILELVRA
jgi:uncharacterized membrane protein HdeD (DUF308 family)